jgi:hypothetical protein
MVQAPQSPAQLPNSVFEEVELSFQLPDPENEQLPDMEFQRQVDMAWQVCDRFDLQTDIWRGRILRIVRDREKKRGEGRGTGFLKWLQEREISKSQAYSWIELADSADTLLEAGCLEPEDVNQFSKRAFVETAQAAPEVQQMVGEAAKRGDRITRREVKQLSDEWTAITSDLLPETIKEKASNHILPVKYLAPLVKEMQKLPAVHQVPIQEALAENPEVETLKQATAEARYLSRYLEAAAQVQALNSESLNLELALEEALRLGCLNSAADLVSQSAQLEQTAIKLFTTWKRIRGLVERVYLDSGASTPHLRSLLAHLEPLSGEVVEVQLGTLEGSVSHTIRLKIESDEEG